MCLLYNTDQIVGILIQFKINQFNDKDNFKIKQVEQVLESEAVKGFSNKNYVITTKVLVIEENLSESNGNLFKCEQFDFISTKKSIIKKHIKSKHNNCSYCDNRGGENVVQNITKTS